MKVDLINGKLAWINAGQTIEINHVDFIQKRYYPKCDLIVALIGKNSNAPDRIVGYTRSGKLIFKSMPPDGFTFAYLCEHPQADIAVVCGSNAGDNNPNTWRDYFFSVNSQNGSLTKMGVAR